MMDDVQQSPASEDWGLGRASNWRLKLCWAPKSCFLTGKKLWGKKAYCGTRIITGPGDPVITDYWIEKDEFIVWRLKGNHYGNT